MMRCRRREARVKATVVRLDVKSRYAGDAAVKGMSCGKDRETIQKKCLSREEQTRRGDEVMFVVHDGDVVLKVSLSWLEKRTLLEPGVRAPRLLCNCLRACRLCEHLTSLHSPIEDTHECANSIYSQRCTLLTYCIAIICQKVAVKAGAESWWWESWAHCLQQSVRDKRNGRPRESLTIILLADTTVAACRNISQHKFIGLRWFACREAAS